MLNRLSNSDVQNPQILRQYLDMLAGKIDGALTGRRNLLINGAFDIWQRGQGAFAGNCFTADRWFAGLVGSTATITRQGQPAGIAVPPWGNPFFMAYATTSVAGANNYAVIYQKIENVRRTADVDLTLSFWAAADSVRPISFEFFQTFGTGGAPSNPVVGIGIKKFTIGQGGVWNKYTHTFRVPSIYGKTIGTAGNDAAGAQFFFDAGSAFDYRTDSLGQRSGGVYLAQIQLEYGPVATDFEQRSFGEELALCQRYFEKSFGVDVAPGDAVDYLNAYTGAAFAATAIRTTIPFKVTKRAIPQITFYRSSLGATNGRWQWYNGGWNDFGTSTISTGHTNVHALVADGNHAAGGFPIYGSFLVCGHWVADAEL